jgi:ADP-heptose:LPS heptosyltransferase
MDKKILILKNDRVGDFFHSLRNIEHLRNHFSEHITDIYLSEINVRFASVLSQSKLNIMQVNYNLSFIEKFNLFLKLCINKYEYVFILSPKNFYFF